MRIAVITASLPTRRGILPECMHSVTAQTLRPVAHLIGVDYERRGSSAVRNALVNSTDADWIAPLDDDDLFYPGHLQTLASASDSADIIYSWCDVHGRPGWNPNRPFDADALRTANYIPITVLMRRSLLVSLGGWRDSSKCANGFEDHDLWLSALDAGARFACVPEVTWRYRFHKGNKTYLGEQAAA